MTLLSNNLVPGAMPNDLPDLSGRLLDLKSEYIVVSRKTQGKPGGYDKDDLCASPRSQTLPSNSPLQQLAGFLFSREEAVGVKRIYLLSDSRDEFADAGVVGIAVATSGELAG